MAQDQCISRLGGWEGYDVESCAVEVHRGVSWCVVHLSVQPDRPRWCSSCLRPCRAIHDLERRRIRDLPVFEHRTVVVFPRVRVACPHCGPRVELLRWLDPQPLQELRAASLDIYQRLKPRDAVETLPEALHHAGYATAGYAGMKWWFMPWRGFGRGFDDYSVPEGDRDVFETARLGLAFLDAHAGKKAFLFLHTYDLHSHANGALPYGTGDPAYSRFSKALGEACPAPCPGHSSSFLSLTNWASSASSGGRPRMVVHTSTAFVAPPLKFIPCMRRCCSVIPTISMISLEVVWREMLNTSSPLG